MLVDEGGEPNLHDGGHRLVVVGVVQCEAVPHLKAEKVVVRGCNFDAEQGEGERRLQPEQAT